MKFSNKLATIDKAMNAEAPTIGMFQRERSREFTVSLLMIWLVYLNNILNLKKPMTEEQIEMCAEEILNEFYTLKVSDLTLLFKRIISGAYGEFYESLSVQKVLSYFRDYFEERCQLAEQQSLRKHQDISSDDAFNFSNNLKRLMQPGSGAKRSGK